MPACGKTGAGWLAQLQNSGEQDQNHRCTGWKGWLGGPAPKVVKKGGKPLVRILKHRKSETGGAGAEMRRTITINKSSGNRQIETKQKIDWSGGLPPCGGKINKTGDYNPLNK